MANTKITKLMRKQARLEDRVAHLLVSVMETRDSSEKRDLLSNALRLMFDAGIEGSWYMNVIVEFEYNFYDNPDFMDTYKTELTRMEFASKADFNHWFKETGFGQYFFDQDATEAIESVSINYQLLGYSPNYYPNTYELSEFLNKLLAVVQDWEYAWPILHAEFESEPLPIGITADFASLQEAYPKAKCLWDIIG